MLVVLSVLLAVAAIALLVYRNGPTLAGPYLVPAALLALMIVLGNLVYPGVQESGPRFLATQSYNATYATAFLTVGLAFFCVGCTLGLGRSRRDDLVVRVEIGSERRRQQLVTVAIGIGVLAVLVYFVGIGGPSGFLQRPGYLQYNAPGGVLGIGNTLVLVAPALLGYAAAVPESARRRGFIYALVVVMLVLTFSTASRRLGLITAFFWIGMVLYLPTKRRLLAGIPVLLVTFTLSGVALSLRGLPESGFLPYAAEGLSDPSSIFRSSAGSVANALAPFAYNALCALDPSVPAGHIWSSVTPLPSQYTDIYQIYTDMQFFSHHPWPTMGTLANWGGVWPVAAFMLVSGAVLGFAGRTALRLNPRGVPIAAILILGVGCYFMLKTLSYSLRTSSRIIWYVLLACLLLRLVYFPIREYQHRKVQSLLDLQRLGRDLEQVRAAAVPGRR